MGASNYLVSFMITATGGQATISQLNMVGAAVTKTTSKTKTATTATTAYGASMGKLAVRALQVIPVWMALRAAMLAIMGTMRLMIGYNLDLEDGMARISTVMQNSSGSITGNMIAVENAIIDMSLKTKTPVKDLAEAFYYLKTANLSVVEAMALFEPTVNAMVGTMSKGKDIARAMAGMWNTMGDTLDKNLTIQEKAARIGDVLSYTYATQDVQLGELVEGYTKLAPYTTGLTESFEEIVTILGVLNTNLLRSGRTGRLLGRTILQITKNSKELTQEFGILFDKDKPISLLRVIEKIALTLKAGQKLTFGQQLSLQKVFATRGGIAPRIMIKVWEDLDEAIKAVGTDAEGFAKRMREIQEFTTRGQYKRMGNIIGATSNQLLKGMTAGTSYTLMLKNMNDAMERSQTSVRALGDSIGYVASKCSAFARVMYNFLKIQRPGSKKIRTRIENIQKYIKEFFETPDEWSRRAVDKETERAGMTNSDKAMMAKLQAKGYKTDSPDILDNIGEFYFKEREVEIKHEIALMKVLGKSQLEMVAYEIQRTKEVKGSLMANDYKLELLKLENKLVEENVKMKSELVNNLQSAELTMLKDMGATERQILEFKKQQILVNKERLGDAITIQALQKNGLQFLNLETRELEKQKKITGDIVKNYMDADAYGKKDIRDVMEMSRDNTPEELVGIWDRGGRFADLLERYPDLLQQAERDALNTRYKEKVDLPFQGTDPGRTMEIGWEDRLAQSIIHQMSMGWTDKTTPAGRHFREEYGLESRTDLPPRPTKFDRAESLYQQFSILRDLFSGKAGVSEKIPDEKFKESIIILVDALKTENKEQKTMLNELIKTNQKIADRINQKLEDKLGNY